MVLQVQGEDDQVAAFENRPRLAICSVACMVAWYGRHGQEELEAYKTLKRFLQSRDEDSAAIFATEDEEMTEEMVEKTWAEVEGKSVLIFAYRNSDPAPQKVSRKALRTPVIGEDMMTFLLDGLLCRASSDWTKVEKLQTRDPWRDASTLRSATRAFLHSHSVLPLDVLKKGHLTRATVEHLIGADIVNSFGVGQSRTASEPTIARGLWSDVPFSNHSCDLNVSKCRIGRRRICTTTRDVQKGEELCITYSCALTNNASLKNRRENLLAAFGFTCQCAKGGKEAGIDDSIANIKAFLQYWRLA